MGLKKRWTIGWIGALRTRSTPTWRQAAILGSVWLAVTGLLPGCASGQEVEQVVPGQPGGVVLLAGLRHQLDESGKLQVDAGGGHTTQVNADIAFLRLSARPAKSIGIFFNYVYVATGSDPGPAGRVHIFRGGAEVTRDVGQFQLANQAEFELLDRIDQPDIRRVRDQLRLYYKLPIGGDRLGVKLFGSEELIFRLGDGLDRDRITAGTRITLDKKIEMNIYYLGDRTLLSQPSRRTGYAVLQFTLIV